MGPWVLGIAVLAALGWAVLRRHRAARGPGGRMPQELRAFLERLRETLRTSHPEVRFRGLIPGEFAVLLQVGEQDTPVPLHEAWRHARAFPHELDRIVAQLVAEVREMGMDQLHDHDFADVAHCVLPQVRSRAWLEEKGVFGDSGLVFRPLGEDLVVVYVIDDSHCMVFLCRAHLRRWRRSEEDLHRLALANLRRLGSEAVENAARTGGPVMLHTGDGYDAARLLLLCEGASEGLIVAVPDRDLLWVGGDEGPDLAQLMAASASVNRDAPHPISPRLYRVRAGSVVPVSGGNPP